MSGIKDISLLLKELTPILNPGEFVFVSTKNSALIKNSEPIGYFKEKEGRTLILKKKEAEAIGLSFDYVASWITLNVHSSLEAVGLTAIFSAALAKHGISCNIVAGYYHDHLFVERNDAAKAMAVLLRLSEK